MKNFASVINIKLKKVKDMKYIKFILLIGILVISLMMAASVGAEDSSSLSLSIQDVIIHDDGRLDIIVYAPAQSELSVSGLSLSVDGQTVPVDSVEALSNAGISTTGMILSDRSAVGATKGLKALASGIIDMMKAGDNAGIAVTGNGHEQMALSEDQVSLKTLIESDLLKRNYQERNLNATIAAAIRYLNQYNQVRDHACLVIISNGENTNETGMTTEELQQIIKENKVTIYTFTFEEEKPRTALINQFEALARLSCGGIATSIRHNASEATVVELLEGIRENERQFRVISCNPAVSGAMGREITLSFANGDYTVTASSQLTAEEEAEYSRIFAAINPPIEKSTPSAKPALTPTAEPTSTPTAKLSPTPTGAPTAAPSANVSSTSTMDSKSTSLIPLMPIVIGGIVVVFILLLVLLNIKKRKKIIIKEEASHNEDVMESEVKENAGNEDITDIKSEAINDKEIQKLSKAVLRVTLTPCNENNSAVYQADMVNEMIIGRDPKRAKMLINYPDLSISGMHLRLSYENDIMKAKDISRNGTFINGKRIQNSVVLNSGDQITMANSAFIITWHVY